MLPLVEGGVIERTSTSPISQDRFGFSLGAPVKSATVVARCKRVNDDLGTRLIAGAIRFVAACVGRCTSTHGKSWLAQKARERSANKNKFGDYPRWISRVIFAVRPHCRIGRHGVRVPCRCLPSSAFDRRVDGRHRANKWRHRANK